jgi:uncharacterized protein (DUF1800 family)
MVLAHGLKPKGLDADAAAADLRIPKEESGGECLAAWLDGLALRLQNANTFAQNVGDNLDPQAVLDGALGPLASEETRLTVARAESKQQALAFVMMAPEFLRR